MYVQIILIFSLIPFLSIASPTQGARAKIELPRSTPLSAKAVTAGYPSLEALAEAAVASLNSNDTTHLIRMTFNREDFLRAYPLFESDTSSSRREFACNFYLEDNRKILNRIIKESGGNVFEVVRIEAQEVTLESTKVGNKFALTRGIKIWVRQGEREIQLRLFKSASRTESGWKIWSFTDN